MRHLVRRPQAFLADVGVALRCRNAGVTQQLLDRAQVGPVVQQVRGKCVAKRVGMRRRNGTSVDRATHVASAHAGPFGIDEQGIRHPRDLIADVQPRANCVNARLAEGQATLL